MEWQERLGIAAVAVSSALVLSGGVVLVWERSLGLVLLGCGMCLWCIMAIRWALRGQMEYLPLVGVVTLILGFGIDGANGIDVVMHWLLTYAGASACCVTVGLYWRGRR